MDLAATTPTRFHTRARANSNFDRDGNFIVSNDPTGSAGESDSSLMRRKFQRTSTDPDPTSSSSPADSNVFRKPSLPASATRAAAAGLEHRPSLNQQQRRRSTLQRENVRVPSGPRDYSSPGKQRKASTASTAPSTADSTHSARSFLPQPQSNAETFFYDSRMAASLTHLAFANPTGPRADLDVSSTSTTPLTERGNGFLPDVSFDDFQTGIRNTDVTNYGANGSPLLNDFDIWSSEATRGAGEYTMARSNLLAGKGDARQQELQKEEVGRTPSLRQRLAAGRQPSTTQQRAAALDAGMVQAKDESWRGRRQSSISQSTSAPILPLASATARPPRKSVGPGLSLNLSKNASAYQANNSLATPDNGSKPSIARNSSLNRASRRTTIQPASSAGAELPRVSTLTATTQSRQNKVKSLQPPPRDQPDSASSPSSIKSASKNSTNTRATTPSSSGNRRQSGAPNRAPSGLGARTISPTDARRYKRMSVMNPPPMPSTSRLAKATPTPQEEILNPIASVPPESSRLPELPRMAQPSPSMIPRRTSNRTPSSARASPDGRVGGMSLSTKSSFSSLVNVSTNNGSSSRLPTPKPRTGIQSNSAMGIYRDPYADTQEHYTSYDGEEVVPPVPAIPKAYESPKDLEAEPPFFSSMLKSSQSRADVSMDQQLDGFPVPSPWSSQTPGANLDMPAETPQKSSFDYHRTKGFSNGTLTAPPPSTAPRTVRQQPDPNGRKNANLQPLRLPPLNLMPLNTRSTQNAGNPGLPRPSQEVDSRDEFAHFQTPEPKRTAKTPSTPMTASKATFFRRQEEASKTLRTSSSHYAMRDVMGMDADGNMLTKYWDDSDPENSGLPIPGTKARNTTITPFSSGSLPKASGEYARLRSRPSGEYMDDEYDSMQAQNASSKPQRVRPQRGATVTSLKSSLSAETPTSLESPIVEAPSGSESKKDGEKKEQQGVRRKLSLGWRRSSSKAANHGENKNSPPQESAATLEAPKERKVLHKPYPSDMPPPKLPASASATWSSDVPSLPSSGRPSFEGFARRKSQMPASISTGNLASGPEADSSAPAGKTRSQHKEQPTPVTASTTSRASSWGTLGSAFRSTSHKPAVTTRHRLTPSTISALAKDKDDLTADDEMSRLSRKRKDVDSAARESEELRKRALARSPVTAEHILHDRTLTGGSVLNVYERGEIVDYEKDGIYFTGTKAARKIIGSLTPTPQPPAAAAATGAAAGEKNGNSGSGGSAASSTNFGYDDERGDYNIVLGDHLAYRYEVVDVLGKGSFGQVVRCVDHKEGAVVAVKIIRNKKRFHQQALVEVGILGKLRDWDPDGAHATLSITSSFYFRSHLCIVTPCLSINLYELIRAHNFTGFSLPLIRRFARQLLACLTLLQTKRIIHCDLKPENILLSEARKADVRVIDFGSSCREEEKVYTYIQSRFYRSPEVILGSTYGLGIDMWSLGCILAELWTGYPIFPGENEQEQLACIMEIFGPPDRHLVDRCTRKKLFFDSVGKPRVTVSSKGRRRRPSSKTLQQALKTDDEAFIDFVSRCLRWDPERRLKPSEAVGHPFIGNLPFHQRPAIPDEARRAAKVRSSAAVPASSATSASNAATTTTGAGTGNRVSESPVKRTAANSAGNAFAQPTIAATPARIRLPAAETPQTAVRNANTTSNSLLHGSPIKNPTAAAAAANPHRRHSTVTSAGAAAMAGSKRASNGVVVGAGPISSGLTVNSAASLQQQRGTSGNLAQIAAQQSMGAAASSAASAAASAAKWRT